MVRSTICFAGKSSLDFGICVEKCPAFVTGTVEYEKIKIPGRNGELVRKSKITMSNYIQPYDIWFHGQSKDTVRDAEKIALWLLLNKGYARLEDTYDPDTYRMALFAGPLDVKNWMLVRGRTSLEFDCKPERFLKSGEFPIVIKNGEKILNNWMPAKPLIAITGTGEADISVGASHVHITDLGEKITLDCDALNAYDGLTNKNNKIQVTGGWPVLENGENSITWSGGIQSVTITPHWWMP